jgi:hypothetical protein
MDNQLQNKNDVKDINEITNNLNNLMKQINEVTPMIDNINKTAQKVDSIKQDKIKQQKDYFMLGGLRISSFMAMIYLMFMTIIGIVDFISNSDIKLLVELLPYWGIVIGISYGGLSVINYVKNKK